MGAFSLGLAIPYLLSGLYLGRTIKLLKRASAPRRWVQWVTGALMIGLGTAMVTGKLTWLTAVAARLWPFKLPLGM
jgi:cytochrome c-type biogenesis protein